MALLLPIVAAGCSRGGSADSDDTVVVGAVMPLSGPAAVIGQSFKKGIELGVDAVNDAGGITVDGEKRDLEVVYKDDESTPAGGQAAVQDLLAENVQIFLGPCVSSSFDTVYGALAEDDTRLVVTPALAAEKHLEDGGLLFKTQASQNDVAIDAYVSKLVDLYDPQRVAVLNTADPTGDAFVKGQVAAFDKLGVEVVYENQVATDTTDYIPIVSAIRSAKPDLVMTPYLDTVAAPFLQQAAQVGFTQPVFAADGGSRGQVADIEDKISTFTWRVTTRSPDNPDDETVAGFRTAYEEKYGEEPASIDFYALSFYDQTQMLAEAIAAAGTVTDVAAISAALPEVDEWPSPALADLYFDKSGLAHYTQQIATLRNGEVTFTDLPIAGE
ncbi:branched-chain amino acid transport system substrate-binding protein [Nocardioides sp. BE266]|uniref:ABC transporter substrate-binding protein n=1 Tax=Nocardioides sp. BE266 TaxID=2817725 RepID=UPI0028621409|nr:ABC transporter substrate-binding protein [Nocardioides sp. BE266]MDR7255088.1 branched-chain amino acid transport system substrate-binding protein [Nocardioides sp. BE266]